MSFQSGRPRVFHCGACLRRTTLAVAVSLLAGAAAADEPATLLPALKVTRDLPVGTTEGTGAYTSEVMGTATPLKLSIRETPQSVTVVTRQQIEDQAMRSLTDVVLSATGVSAKLFDRERSGYAARGFDIDNIQIDGVPTTWSAGWSAGETQTDMVIYDRVEIVRGATGLMTGAGNPSAAINLVRKRANSREFGGEVSASVGSWDSYRGVADVSVPLAAEGRVRARVVGAWQQNDSFMDYAEDERRVYYAVFDADLTENTLLSIGASRQENDPKGSTWGGLPSWFSDGSRTDWSRSDTTAAKWSAWGSVQRTWFADLEHDFANGWKVQAGFTRGENSGDLRLLYLSGAPDSATGLGMGASPSRYDTSREQDSFDITVSGPFELFGRSHEAAVGYMRSEQDFVAYGYDRSGVAGVGNFLAWDGSYPEPVWGGRSVSEEFETRQSGLYGVARFALTDALRAIVGARVSSWKTAGTNWAGAYAYDYDDEVLPYAGLIYDIGADYSVYVSYTDIFNVQNARDVTGRLIDPITGETYEGGIKAALFDGRVNASLAVFQTKQDNLAQPDPVGIIPGSNPPMQAYYAAEGTESTGYEFEIAGELTPGWNLSLGWSQFTAEDADGVDVNTNHPRRQLKLFTSYRAPGVWNRLVVGGGVNWQSSNYTAANNPFGLPERLEQSSYALTSLMARYEFTDQLSAQLNVNNVFDKEYYSQIGFYGQLAHGEPRSAVAMLKYRF